MTAREHANAQLKALSDFAGLAPLALDENDAALADIHGLLFAFAYSDEAEELASCVYIGPPPVGDKREDFLREVMEGNYAWAGTDGGILGLDPDTGMICLSRRYSPDNASDQDFIEKIARQASLAEYWKKRLVPEQPLPADATRA